MSIVCRPLDQPRPGDPSIAQVEEIYSMATARGNGDRVDCASCTQRHPLLYLTWFEVDFGPEGAGWFVAPICGGCETLDYDRIEHQIMHRQQPPLRKTVGRHDGELYTFWVADPDFAMDRAS